MKLIELRYFFPEMRRKNNKKKHKLYTYLYIQTSKFLKYTDKVFIATWYLYILVYIDKSQQNRYQAFVKIFLMTNVFTLHIKT